MDQERYQNILSSWDAKAELDKAIFLDYLFQYYKPESRTYTGLWQRFQLECALKAKKEILQKPELLLKDG
jgi:hypothetical protein